MHRLSKLIVGNFKAFGETQEIPIRPITLIFGPNSAGKSSILHAIAFLRNFLRNRGDCNPRELPLGWSRVDLGGWENLVHRHIPNAVMEIGIDLTAVGGRDSGLHDARLGQGNRAPNSNTDRISWSISKSSLMPLPIKCQIDRNGVTIEACRNIAYDRILWIEQREKGHPGWLSLRDKVWSFLCRPGNRPSIPGMPELLRKTVEKESDPVKRAKTLTTIHGLQPLDTARFTQERFNHLFSTWLDRDCPRSSGTDSPVSASRVREGELVTQGSPASNPACAASDHPIPGWSPIPPKDWNDPQFQDMRLSASDFNSCNEPGDMVDLRSQFVLQVAQGNPDETLLFSMLDRALEIFEFCYEFALDWQPLHDILEHHIHVGPVRPAPPRKVSMQVINAENREEWAPWRSLLENEACRQLANQAFRDLEVACQLAVRWHREIVYRPGSKPEGDLRNSIETDDRAESLAFVDPRSGVVLSHVDLGFGVATVLPILVALTTMDHSLVSVEEPELHIHPRLQSGLGDLVIQSTLGNSRNTAILETHSEHLILRILRRIRETTRGRLPEGMPPVRPEDVAVLYVEPGPEGAQVRELRIDPQGRFMDRWPEGFFEERLDELF